MLGDIITSNTCDGIIITENKRQLGQENTSKSCEHTIAYSWPHACERTVTGLIRSASQNTQARKSSVRIGTWLRNSFPLANHINHD